MAPQAINRELAHALRLALPYVRICGSHGYTVKATLGTALRALVDADAEHARTRRAEFEAVKNILAEESTRFVRLSVPSLAIYADALRPGARISDADAFMQAARAVRPGEGYLPAAPPAKGCDCDICTQYRRASLRNPTHE